MGTDTWVRSFPLAARQTGKKGRKKKTTVHNILFHIYLVLLCGMFHFSQRAH
ncbi:Uncharacterized protein APZ42_028486 [Daphnia magna]|uniref:Uncharacterized protein n=1 Tax=Daphnia magna TaxID=35525 RepID=A0A164QGK5_9CRUS|nr:Uncharacterized protein APZ42_028486 [Daphnia magna]